MQAKDIKIAVPNNPQEFRQHFRVSRIAFDIGTKGVEALLAKLKSLNG